MPAKEASQPRRLTKENIDTVGSNMARKSSDVGVPMPQTTHAQMRRASKWDPNLLRLTENRRMSIMSRTSISGVSMAKPSMNVRYENTYKLTPDTSFQPHKARDVMQQTMKEWLTGVEYTPNVRNITTGLSDEIKKRVKALGYERYKFIVTVTICQQAKQSMQIVSRCLWNKDTDNFAESVFRTGDICAIATLYAVYFE